MDKRIRFCILLFLVLVAVKELFSESNRCVGRKCSRAASRNLRTWKRAASLKRTLWNDKEEVVESIVEDTAEGEHVNAFIGMGQNFILNVEPFESGTFTVCVSTPQHNSFATNNEEGSLVYFRLKGYWMKESYTPETLFSPNRHAVVPNSIYRKSCYSFNSNFPRRPLIRLKWKNVGWDGIRPKSWYVCKKEDDNYKYKCPMECKSGLGPECYKKTSSDEHEQTTSKCVRVTNDACNENWFE